MEANRVYELNELAEELKIPLRLYKVIVAKSLAATRAYVDRKEEERAFNIACEALKRVDVTLVTGYYKSDYNVTLYGIQLVQEVMQEKGYNHR